MKSWFPIDVESWPEISAMLEVKGGEWPQWAATADLRWHVDQRKKFPTRPMLQARWGWSDRRVRAHLADTPTWWDPSKGAPPESRPELRERVNRSGTDSGPKLDRSRTDPEPIRNEQTPEGKQKRTDPEPILDRERTDPEPKMSIARVHHPTPPPITDTATGQHEGASPLDPIHLDPCQICGHIVAAGCRHGITGSLFDHRPSEAVQTPQATTDLALVPPKPPRAKPAPAKGNGESHPAGPEEVAKVWAVYRRHRPTIGPAPSDAWKVPAAVEKVGSKALILIIDWAFLSQESRPHFLRESKSIGQTLFRPAHLDEYRTLATEWDAGGRRARRSMTSAEAKADANRRALEYVNSPSLNTVDEHGNIIDEIPF